MKIENRFAKIKRFFGKKRLFKETSDYSFYFVAIKKGARIRHNLNKLSNLDLRT